MKVVIAVDSFKGSVSSIEASAAISSGIQEVFPDANIVTLPLADGGEGTVEALVAARNGKFVQKVVKGPLGKPVEATYGLLDDNTAVIEVAAACGLPLLTVEERNPMITTTYGVGELIVDAMKRGCRNFVIGLGGSATNDGGIGMLQALGFHFYDETYRELPLGGASLSLLKTIDVTNVHPMLKNCTFRVACDVNNPLHGPNGAAYIYAGQKGATPKMIVQLDKGLKNYANKVLDQLLFDIQNIQGAGAAGGLGAAFSGFLNGKLESGINLVLDIIEMESHLQDVDVIITGEGKLDYQTAMGKAPMGVAKLANKYGIPVIALAGSVPDEPSLLNEQGITSYFSILTSPISLHSAMEKDVTIRNLQATVSQLFRLINSMKK